MALAPWNAPNLKLTGSSSRAAAIAGGANAGNRSSTIGSGSTLRVSGSEPTAKLGPQSVMDLINKQGTVGINQQGPLKTGYVTASQAQAAANQTLANRISAATPAGQIVVSQPTGPTGDGGGAGDGGKAGDGGGAGGTGGDQTPTEEAPAEGEKQDVAAMLNALINQLLEADFLGFQGERAAELRRLQNLRNQLYGDTEFGTTGSIQRQQQLDAAARRRLAASRAVAGMLGGGAYAGTQRGLGTIQRADQDFAIQEMERPYREQTAADRLREFGLTYTPSSRLFDLSNFGLPDDIMGGWAKETWGGKQAAARARLAALEQLRQRGMTL